MQEREQPSVSHDEKDATPGDPLHLERLTPEQVRELADGERLLVSLRVVDCADDLPLHRFHEMLEIIEYIYDVALWVHDPFLFKRDIPTPEKRRPQRHQRPDQGYEARVHFVHYGSDLVTLVWATGAVVYTLSKLLPVLHPYVEMFFARPPREVRKAEDEKRISEANLAKVKADEEARKIRLATDRPAALGGKAERDSQEREQGAEEEVAKAVEEIHRLSKRGDQ